MFIKKPTGWVESLGASASAARTERIGPPHRERPGSLSAQDVASAVLVPL
jgi:hypothetical protein